MPSLKIVLRNKPNSHGLYPLAIQIIKDRKSSLIFTGQYVEKAAWDTNNQKVRKSHPNSNRLNSYIKHKLAEVNQKMIESELEGKPHSAASLKKEISGGGKKNSFFRVADEYLGQLLKSKKFNQHSTNRANYNHLRSFLNGQDISIKDITPSLLRNYMAYLMDEQEVSKRTVMNKLIGIRTVLNMAAQDDPSLKKYYPFGRGKILIKFPETEKIGLTKKEVISLESLKLNPNTTEWHALNVWLFALYFAGMRISDVLKLTWADFHDDRLYYAMSKNDKVGSLTVPTKAQNILDRYRSQAFGNLVFPFLQEVDLNNLRELYRQTKNSTKRINRSLKKIAALAKIKKPLTTHIARHTFGNISGDSISPIMLQKLYRHSSLSTTIGYQSNFIYKDADEALEAVIGK